MLIPGLVSALFVVVVFGVALLVVAGVQYATGRPGHTRWQLTRPAALTLLALSSWLALTAMLAASGFLRAFDAVPPRLVVVIAPALLAVIVLTIAPGMRQLLDAIPTAWLIDIQVFRVAVEVILWLLYQTGAIAGLMTFEGRNLDILVGLTAPLVSFLVIRRRLLPASATVVWHVVGLLLLFNVAAHGLLSTPSPVQVFVTQPPFTIIADVPFIWLPALLVPLAALFHTLALRQLLSQRRVASRALGRA